jgi:hypothetical protein
MFDELPVHSYTLLGIFFEDITTKPPTTSINITKNEDFLDGAAEEEKHDLTFSN